MGHHNTKSRLRNFSGVMVVGAVLQYYLDPQSGRRRRALLSDKAYLIRKKLGIGAEITRRDFRNRAQGLRHEFGKLMRGEEVSDEKVAQRVRATIGHFSHHPSAIKVQVQNQIVQLSGPVLKREKRRILWAVATVRGVKGIQDNLTPHTHTDDVPALQGAQPLTPFFIWNRQFWPPSYRGVFGLMGMGLAGWGLKRGFCASGVFGLASGSLLVIRAVTNTPIRKALGYRSGPDVVDIRKSITINAPVEEVYRLWQQPEEFPSFMRNVRAVQQLSNGTYRWTVRGPMGVDVSWETQEPTCVENEEISWCSVPGSMIEHEGRVRFESANENQTIAHVHLSYNPPAGALGHAVACIFGANPRTEIEEDLMRMKSMVETGNQPHDAARRRA